MLIVISLTIQRVHDREATLSGGKAGTASAPAKLQHRDSTTSSTGGPRSAVSSFGSVGSSSWGSWSAPDERVNGDDPNGAGVSGSGGAGVGGAGGSRAHWSSTSSRRERVIHRHTSTGVSSSPSRHSSISTSAGGETTNGFSGPSVSSASSALSSGAPPLGPPPPRASGRAAVVSSWLATSASAPPPADDKGLGTITERTPTASSAGTVMYRSRDASANWRHEDASAPAAVVVAPAATSAPTPATVSSSPEQHSKKGLSKLFSRFSG